MTTRNHPNAYMCASILTQPITKPIPNSLQNLQCILTIFQGTNATHLLCHRIINAMHFVFRFTLFIDWIINYANVYILGYVFVVHLSIAHTDRYTLHWMSAIYDICGHQCVFYEINLRTKIVLCSLPKSETQLSRSELSEYVTRSHIVNDSERNYMLENCAFQIYFIVFSRLRLVGLRLLDFYNLSWFTLKAGIMASGFGSRLYTGISWENLQRIQFPDGCVSVCVCVKARK